MSNFADFSNNNRICLPLFWRPSVRVTRISCLYFLNLTATPSGAFPILFFSIWTKINMYGHQFVVFKFSQKEFWRISCRLKRFNLLHQLKLQVTALVTATPRMTLIGPYSFYTATITNDYYVCLLLEPILMSPFDLLSVHVCSILSTSYLLRFV